MTLLEDTEEILWCIQINRIIMTNLSTKIKLYANQEIDFCKDVLLQDDGQRCLHQGMES
jgi:hypothetical protein